MADVPSGFTVKTYVAPSKTGGLGLFAAEPIPKGTVWWRPLLNVNYLRLSRGQFRSLYLSEHTRSPCSKQLWDGINTYAFYVKDDDSLWLVMDNARFVNHSSDSSNSNFSPSEGSVTTRDVAVDEELVEDYRHYDQCPWPEYEETDEFCQQILPKNNELVAAYLAAHPEDPVEPTALVALETYVEDTGSERGMGLYLGKDVTKGEVLWTRTATNHLDIYQAAWRTLCASELEQSPVSKAFHEGVLVYCYYESRRDALVLCLDNARFINHDQNGPVHTMYQTEGAEGNTVFIRDAVKGEELVDDYYEYDECAWAALIWEPYIKYPRKVPPV